MSFQAGRGDSCRGDGDNGVDVARGHFGGGERPAHRDDEEVARAFDIGRIAIRPAVRFGEPAERLRRGTGADAGGLEHFREASEVPVAIRKESGRDRRDFALVQQMFRKGRFERKQSDGHGFS